MSKISLAAHFLELKMSGKVSNPINDYNAVGTTYDQFFTSIMGKISTTALNMVPISPGDQVVELACGTGHLTREIQSRLQGRGSIMAVDKSEGMIAVAKRKVKSNANLPVDFTINDMMSLPHHESRIAMLRKPHLDQPDRPPASAKYPVMASSLCKEVSPRRGEIVRVLESVDFQAAWGQLTGIVGPSGSGKSTLLYCLAGLESVSSGTVSVLGSEVSAMSLTASARFRRAHLGFVFQSYNLVPSMTVEDNVKLPFTLRGVKFPRDAAVGVIARLGIGKLLNENVTLLSGGEQQRVALARTLVADPQVIFADEPTGALDVDTGRRVVDEFAAFAARPDHAVVMVTHSPEVAARCDRVVRLSDGRIIDSTLSDPIGAGA